jgi:hypothetical protein
MVPVVTWGSGRTSLDGNKGCLLSVGASLGSLTTSSTLALPTLAFGLPVSVFHVLLHVLSNSSVGSGVVLSRCLFKALRFALVGSRRLLSWYFATLPSLGKLGLSKKPLGNLLTVFTVVTRSMMAPTVSLAPAPRSCLASCLATSDTLGAFWPPSPMKVSPSCITRVCHDGRSVSSRVI